MPLSPPPQGDSITLTKQVNENWVEGKLGDKVGIFPLQLTEVRQQAFILPKTSYMFRSDLTTIIIKQLNKKLYFA